MLIAHGKQVILFDDKIAPESLRFCCWCRWLVAESDGDVKGNKDMAL